MINIYMNLTNTYLFEYYYYDLHRCNVTHEIKKEREKKLTQVEECQSQELVREDSIRKGRIIDIFS